MTKIKHLLILILINFSTNLFADKMEILKAEGIITDSFVSPVKAAREKFTLDKGLTFLVVKLSYKITIDDIKLFKFDASDALIYVEKDKLTLRSIGKASSGNYYHRSFNRIFYDKAVKGKVYDLVLVYAIPENRKAFTLKFADANEMKVTLSPKLKPLITHSTDTPFLECQVVSAKLVKSYIYSLRAYGVQDTIYTAEIENLVEISMNYRNKENLKASISRRFISVRCKNTGLIRDFLFGYGAGANASLERIKIGDNKGYNAKFTVKLPKECKNFEVMYIGNVIARGSITK
jgi:hypothetical protein